MAEAADVEPSFVYLPDVTSRFLALALDGQPAVPFPEPGVLPAPSTGIRKPSRSSFGSVMGHPSFTS